MLNNMIVTLITPRDALYACDCVVSREDIDINDCDNDGVCALVWSASRNKSACAMAILKHKDANAKLLDSNCKTALHYACSNGDVALVTALLEKLRPPIETVATEPSMNVEDKESKESIIAEYICDKYGKDEAIYMLIAGKS
jgi:ankyrin repeat protein